jgi:4-hydroxybenzoate polyprenyltransferase
VIVKGETLAVREEGGRIGTGERIRRYVAFTRPFTLLPPTLGVVSGAVCAWGSVHNPDPLRQITFAVVFNVVLGSLCAALLNAASNVINQIYDLDVDNVNKPERMLPSGRIRLGAAWRYTWVLYALAVIPVWLVVIYPAQGLAERMIMPTERLVGPDGPLEWLGALVASHAVFFIYIAGMIFTFVYSAPSLGRTKRHAIGANVTIAIPRGMLLKVAGWGMVGPVLATEPWYIGLIFALFLLGAASTKDFSDMEGDRAGGCYTLPIRYGVRRAAYMMAPSFVLPWLLVPLGVFLPDPFDAGRHPILTGDALALVALGLLLAAWGGYTVWLILRDPEALATTENHPSWTHMYLMMMVAQIGFAVAYLV